MNTFEASTSGRFTCAYGRTATEPVMTKNVSETANQNDHVMNPCRLCPARERVFRRDDSKNSAPATCRRHSRDLRIDCTYLSTMAKPKDLARYHRFPSPPAFSRSTSNLLMHSTWMHPMTENRNNTNAESSANAPPSKAADGAERGA